MTTVLGRHMPLGSRPGAHLRIARDIGCDAVQIFASNPRGWAPPAENAGDVTALATALSDLGFACVVIHAAYLINLASNSAETRAKSIRLLRWTMERGAALGATEVVLHTGSHGGDGLALGVDRVVAGLEEVGAALGPGPRLLLENDVGAGNTIGGRFETLAAMMARLGDSWDQRMGVCVDTAHLWGAGFDIGTPAAASATLDGIAGAIDLDRVSVIHLNDTKTALGGHRDMHARLGEGIIGAEGLRAFMRDPRLARATVLLETPINKLPDSDEHDWEDDRRQITAARALCAGD